MTVTAKIQRLLPAALLFCISFFQPEESKAQVSYPLQVRYVDRDSASAAKLIRIETLFASRQACVEYISRLPSMLQAKGFVTSSLDSVFLDSSFARVIVYLGQRYQWASLNTAQADPQALSASGWNPRQFTSKPIDFEQVKIIQQRMLNYLENNGYPFAKIFLDSIQLTEDSVRAALITDKGPLYKIDSIRIYGDAKISNSFLQHYLDIKNGSIYNRDKIERVSSRIAELPYAQEERPANLSMLGTGAVLNLYLKQKRSSQVNALIGFLPNSDQSASKKMIITGEANVFLRNAFGGGESFGLNWQQLQVKSPRLNIFYRHPYVFNSSVGLDFSFDMLRKDSTYLNIDLNIGAGYEVSATETARIYFRFFQTIISQGGINDAKVIITKSLPDISDMNSLALGGSWGRIKTNYRLNPRSGYEFSVNGMAGSKTIKKNNEILELKDPSNPSFDFNSLYDTVNLDTYQFRIIAAAAKYIPMGKQGTLKTAFNSGFYFSQNIYRNELFQIGGYKLLRGFDEESQYVSQYIVGTAEYRYLIGLNSFFFGFVDGAWAKNAGTGEQYSHTYLGTGLGLALETKAGIFNLAWAVGKRDDIPFNLRQSKIHVGFVNYF